MQHLEKIRTAFGIGVILFIMLLCITSCIAQINLMVEDDQPTESLQNREKQSIKHVPEEETRRYYLADAERSLVEQVVMAEAGGEPYCGQVAVAQCILNAAETDDVRPAEVFEKYQYTPKREEPTDSVQKAVSAVFDRGEIAVEDDILWFYAPAGVDSTPWHETQRYVCTIEGHKFFAPKNDA